MNIKKILKNAEVFCQEKNLNNKNIFKILKYKKKYYEYIKNSFCENIVEITEKVAKDYYKKIVFKENIFTFG